MTDLIDPLDGKGPNDLFRFGGGDDVIVAMDSANGGYNIFGGAGNDSITGSSAGDTLAGGKGSDEIAGGGGADIIFGANDNPDEGKDRATTVNTLYGEASSIVLAGNDTASGDTIFGGDGATNDIYGDYQTIDMGGAFTFIGGNDTILGGSLAHGVGAVNNIHGDAEFVTMGTGSVFVGGDDTITGGADSDNSMFGDAFSVAFTGAGAAFTGGNDTIRGGDGAASVNDLYGDAQTVDFNGFAATYTNGNDTLISGAGTNDVMRGDTVQYNETTGTPTIIFGADTFVFETGNGRDEIVDFHFGEDVVLLQGIANIGSLDDLAGRFFIPSFTTSLALELDGTVDGQGDMIIFNGHTLADVGSFTEAEFMFA